MPAARAATTTGADQPETGPSIAPYVSPMRPNVTSTPPVTSIGPVASGSRDSGTCRTVAKITYTASGTLMTKMSRQDTAATSQPPRNGPIAVPTPLNPAQEPIALLRSSSRKVAEMIARLPGVSSAAPMPCNARAPMSVPAFGATLQSADATANQAIPMTNTRLRPNMSPSDPAMSSKPASVRV